MTSASTTSMLLLLAPIGALALLTASTAEAATPTYYANLATFQGDITSTVTDDYANPGYVFIQNNAAMSAVLGQTDYMSTGFNNHNIVSGGVYCAGCNGSFQLMFQTTTVGNAIGVNGVGMNVQFNDPGNPYFAFITFADGTTANIQMPAAGNFWGVAAPERIQQIHFGLSMGGVTQGGSFGIDNLIVGDGNVGGCVVDADCFDDADPCTSPVCLGDMCGFAFNTAPCNDGNICTEMDTCAAGVCNGGPVDCDDGNVCTTNFCDPAAGCVLALNTEPCDDGNSCTSMDVCAAGACGGEMLDCNDDDVCSMDSCVNEVGCVNEPTAGCCAGDEDCGVDEICDPATNECVPAPAGSSGEGDSGEPGDTGDTGRPGDTGVDGTGNGDSGIGTDGGDTGSVDTGGSSGGDTGVGLDGGDTPDPDFSVCACTTNPSPEGRLWWLMGALGLFLRRRRGGN